MFVKLTHYGLPTIFNVADIVSFRLDIDNKGNEKTKLFLVSGAHTFVDEGVKELHRYLNDIKMGKEVVSYEYDVPSIPDRMEGQYNREMQSPRAMEYEIGRAHV